MKGKSILRAVAVLCAVAALVAGCSSDDDSGSKSSGSKSGGSGNGNAEFVKLGGWNDGACSSSKPEVAVAISAPVDVAGTSLKGYVDGTEAAVDAFNKRGGINGQCMALNVCDGKGDGPTELACARKETENSKIVAGLASTFILSEAAAYQLFEGAGLSQIGAQVTQPGAWNSPVSFDFTMGGTGTLLADIPALDKVGVKKFAVMIPESPQAGALKAFAAPLIKSLGMELTEIIGIPPTAVDYTQFVLKAQNSGADGVVLGLPTDVIDQVIDAMDSLNSPLKAAASWGSFSQSSVESLPEEIAKNTAYSDGVPPVATDLANWPIYNVVLDDFAASDKPELTSDKVTVQAVNGWLSVYVLAKVMRDAKPTEITRDTVKQAFDKAKDVPMFDLTPPWTPSKQSTNSIFKGISNPNYWTGTWDPDKKQFVVDDKQVDILALLG
jgi:ABC-type branched-subunit amino acid transport system substrate-binding protein